MPTFNITWQTPLTNAVINGNGELEKNAGANNCFTNASGSGDAGARSVETITGGDWEFQCTLGPSPSGRSFVGISRGSYSTDFTTWDYCIHVSTESNTSGTPHPADSLFIYEGSPPNKTYLDGVWDEGKLLRIVCQNGVVRYYLDSLLVYTSSKAPIYPAFACVSLACLNKTVVAPKLITSSGAAACAAGNSSGDSCSAPWVIPTPSAFPVPANGGPVVEYFAELEPDWNEFNQVFADGNAEAATIQTAAVRRFRLEWDGLSEAEAAILDNHFDSTRGGLSFTLARPDVVETINGVRYEKYERGQHRKVWSQSRAAVLVKYTN